MDRDLDFEAMLACELPVHTVCVAKQVGHRTAARKRVSLQWSNMLILSGFVRREDVRVHQ